MQQMCSHVELHESAQCRLTSQQCHTISVYLHFMAIFFNICIPVSIYIYINNILTMVEKSMLLFNPTSSWEAVTQEFLEY